MWERLKASAPWSTRSPRYALIRAEAEAAPRTRNKTVEVDEMLEQLMRVVEAQISLSVSVARSGAVFAGRVASWALTEVARQVLPEREDPAAPSAADEHPAESASTSTWEPEVVDGAQEPEELEAVSVTEEEPAALSPSDEEREAARSAADEETAPGGATETETAVTQNDAPTLRGDEALPEPVGASESKPPIGGEDGAVVEHEPGIGTSVRARNPHSPLNNPVTEADLTEWPDPYDHREDPLDPGEEMAFGGEAGHPQTGATSTSEPHPSQDPEATHWEGPKRDKVDQ